MAIGEIFITDWNTLYVYKKISYDRHLVVSCRKKQMTKARKNAIGNVNSAIPEMPVKLYKDRMIIII